MRIWVVVDTRTDLPVIAFRTEEAAMDWEDQQWEKDPQHFESQIYPVRLSN